MNPFDFYFDYRSPYSYLAFTQLRGLVGTARFQPFDIRDVMQRVGNVPTSAICKVKNEYVRADLQRWAARYGVALVRHPRAAEIDARRLLRATLAVGPDDGAARASAAATLFHAMWRDAATLDTVTDVSRVLTDAGLDGRRIELLIDDPATDAALDACSARAAERGVFGAPTFVVGSDMYFGNDRLEFLRQRLSAAP
jgi:2-hydroxychromene-2-carboxylate isomerase